jgi:hypothetical protein
MSYDKPIQRIATGGGLLIVLSAIAVAQTPAPRSDTRSYEMRTLLRPSGSRFRQSAATGLPCRRWARIGIS